MTILCYHTVEPTWTSPLSVTPALFDAHCAWLAATGRVVMLDDAVGRLRADCRPAARPIALTFDDGFSGVFEHALPILRRHRLPASLFVVAQTLAPGGRTVDWVDTPPDFPLRTVSAEQVLELQESGVAIGSHSWAHHDLCSLGEDECERDLRSSREQLESVLARPVHYLAYPRGFHSPHVRRAAARAGYTHAFALPEHLEEPGPHAVPRVGVHGGNSVAVLRLKCSSAFLGFKVGRPYRLARRLTGRRPAVHDA